MMINKPKNIMRQIEKDLRVLLITAKDPVAVTEVIRQMAAKYPKHLTNEPFQKILISLTRKVWEEIHETKSS